MSNPNYPFVVISLNISKICAQCVHIEKTKLVLKSELKTLIGMITYLSIYAPHLSQTMKPLSELLKADKQF